MIDTTPGWSLATRLARVGESGPKRYDVHLNAYI
jgi:hypothetical protein